MWLLAPVELRQRGGPMLLGGQSAQLVSGEMPAAKMAAGAPPRAAKAAIELLSKKPSQDDLRLPLL